MTTGQQNTKERFSNLNAQELIVLFNLEVSKNGWTSSRSLFLNLLIQEMISRHWDVSSIFRNGHLNLSTEINFDPYKKIVVLE